MDRTVRVMSYNVLNGGRDGASDERWRGIVEVVGDAESDVLLLQEARGFDADGSRLLFAAERDLGMRGLLAVAPHTGQHTAVLFRPEIRPLSFAPDCTHFHHALAQATLEVPGFDRPLVVASIHLSPLSPALRAAEVGWMAALAAPGTYAVVAGDANSLAPGDPEPTDWAALPAHFQVRYLQAGALQADRSALAFLEAAGFTNAGTTRGASGVATVPTRGFPQAEFVPFRSDHAALSPDLAPALAGYQVIETELAHATSDHLPIVIDLDPARLTSSAGPAA